jgi:hypothetical protein
LNQPKRSGRFFAMIERHRKLSAEYGCACSEAVFGSIGSQGSATDVPCLRVRAGRSWDRKSIQPMAERLAPVDYDQLHHLVATGVWEAGPLERELLVQADKLVGGSDAVLVIEDAATRFNPV